MNLQKAVMLTSVSIKLEGLLGERRDRQASELVESTYLVASKRAKASKFLIDRKHPKVKAVIATAQQIRAVVYRYTFPWGDTNLRLLPTKAFTEFKAKLNTAMEDHQEAIRQYVIYYPSLVIASETDLGGLFDAAQYPPVSDIAARFQCQATYWPMPESGHFVADIANDAAQEARDSIIRETVANTNQAVNILVNRVENTVATYVEKLASYKVSEGGEIDGIFRDSLVDNVSDIAKLTRTLNFTNDPGIDKLAVQIERLVRWTPDTLRKYPANRDMAVNEGKLLIAQLDAFRRTDTEISEIIQSLPEYTL